MSDTKPQIQEAQRKLGRVNAKRTIAKHTFKLKKIKDKVLKKAAEGGDKNKNTLPIQEQREE